MNDGYSFVPIFGLVSFVGAIVGLLYFNWYEHHQREWRIRFITAKQKPDFMKIIVKLPLTTPLLA